jgi:hypothetical protein
LTAHAGPQAVVAVPGRCGNTTTDLVSIPALNQIAAFTLRDKFIKTNAPASPSPSNGGLVLDVKAEQLSRRFENILINVDCRQADLDSCFVVLDFDMPGNTPDVRKVVSFNQALFPNKKDKLGPLLVRNGKEITGVGDAKLKGGAILLQSKSTKSQVLVLGFTSVFYEDNDNEGLFFNPKTRLSCSFLF